MSEKLFHRLAFNNTNYKYIHTKWFKNVIKLWDNTIEFYYLLDAIRYRIIVVIFNKPLEENNYVNFNNTFGSYFNHLNENYKTVRQLNQRIIKENLETVSV